LRSTVLLVKSRLPNEAPTFEMAVTPTFASNSFTANAGGATSVVTADLNGDGYLDLVSANFTDDTLTWYENDGSGNFHVHTLPHTIDGANSVAVEDIDGDGDLDLIATAANDATITWYENDGTQGFATAHVIAMGTNINRLMGPAIR